MHIPLYFHEIPSIFVQFTFLFTFLRLPILTMMHKDHDAFMHHALYVLDAPEGSCMIFLASAEVIGIVLTADVIS